MSLRISDNFWLKEFLPKGVHEDDVPADVLGNLEYLVATVLQPMRDHFGVVNIHSGWRPPDKNAAVGGVQGSDHTTGRAADFHIEATKDYTWEDNTVAAFHWLKEHRQGTFGQLILEDHRVHYGQPGKLWVHVAIPSEKHDGTATDPNRLLVSAAPRVYEPWTEGRFG